MPIRYLLHLPDGTRYGPVDREMLDAWHAEGRLPPETLVWPEGAPEWLSLEGALGAKPEGEGPQAATATTVVLEPKAASEARAPAPSAPAAPPAAPPAGPAPASAAPSPASTPASEPSAPAKSASRPPAPAESAAPAAPVRDTVELKRPSGVGARRTGPHERRPAAGPSRRAAPAVPRALVLGGIGVAVVLAVLVGVFILLRPVLARRQAIAEVARYAIADRRVDDPAAGFAVDLPPSWMALRDDNPFVVRPGALLRVADPTASAFGAVTREARPRLMDDLDGYLDEVLQERLPRQPSQKPGERTPVQLGRGQGRLVRTTWDDGLVAMQGATVAWADGYELYALETWAPASTGAAFSTEVEALCRGITPKGDVATRVGEAVDRLAIEVPELSPDALRLLVSERMSRGAGLEDVPRAALRGVIRGLDALGASEAGEMRAIYQKIWAPVPEGQRVRLAHLLDDVKAGRPVAPSDLEALRSVVNAGVLALPEDERARLQELSSRAVRKSLLLP
jgi:hypothetical protein